MSKVASLKARIATGYALCAIADSQIRAGEYQPALKTIRAVREMVAEISALLVEPFPHTSLREAADFLTTLEARVNAVEKALPPL